MDARGCTSHHIRAETLDALVKDYVRKVRDNSSTMLERLNADLEKEQTDIAETKRTEENLEALLLDKQEELKATKRQRIRDMMKHPEQEALLGGNLRRAGGGADAAHCGHPAPDRICQ